LIFVLSLLLLLFVSHWLDSRSRSRSPQRLQRRRSSSPESQNDGTSLHVSNLHARTQERDLESLCAEYGKVLSAKLCMDPKTGANATLFRFCFVFSFVSFCICLVLLFCFRFHSDL
jgi:RNA recognition motif-containing protein